MEPYVSIRGLRSRRAVVCRLGSTTGGRAAVDIMASTSTVGAHKWEECRNNVVYIWKLGPCSVGDDDEETVELGEGNLSLLRYRLAAGYLNIEVRNGN